MNSHSLNINRNRTDQILELEVDSDYFDLEVAEIYSGDYSTLWRRVDAEGLEFIRGGFGSDRKLGQSGEGGAYSQYATWRLTDDEAKIVFSRDRVFGNQDLVVRIKRV